MSNLAAYDAFVAGLDGPVFIVTVSHADTRAGCVIGFGSQVSIDPPRFLACLSDKNRTYRVAAAHAEHLGLHLVPPQRCDLAALFGGTTGDDVDKFDHCAWHEGPRGVPILDACPDWFAGRVLERRPLGDHVGFLLEPVAAAYEGAGALALSRAQAIEAGHEA